MLNVASTHLHQNEGKNLPFITYLSSKWHMTMLAKTSLKVKQWLLQVVLMAIKYKMVLLRGKFPIINSVKLRSNFGATGRKYSLSRQICIVSSSGTFANREVTSKEHIISLPCFVHDLAQSAKLNESSTMCWLVEIG